MKLISAQDFYDLKDKIRALELFLNIPEPLPERRQERQLRTGEQWTIREPTL